MVIDAIQRATRVVMGQDSLILYSSLLCAHLRAFANEKSRLQQGPLPDKCTQSSPRRQACNRGSLTALVCELPFACPTKYSYASPSGLTKFWFPSAHIQLARGTPCIVASHAFPSAAFVPIAGKTRASASSWPNPKIYTLSLISPRPRSPCSATTNPLSLPPSTHLPRPTLLPRTCPILWP